MSAYPETVLFLGAGASRAFGYPLTDDILPRVLASKPSELFEEGAKPKSKELKRCIEALVPGHNGAGMPSIVEILSLLDHGILQGHALGHDGRRGELARWRKILEEALFSLITVVDNEEDPGASTLLERLGGSIAEECGRKPGSVALVSTNYDISVEYQLFQLQNENEAIAQTWDFGTSWRDPEEDKVYVRPASPTYRLYKLHGATNWLRCARCEHLYVNPHGTIAHQYFRTRLTSFNSCECGHGPLRTVIVAPSMVRDFRDPILFQVWTSAFECLRRARRLVFIGYSLPHEDIAIRSLLLRAVHGRSRSLPALEVKVVQRKRHTDRVKRARQLETEGRYRALFPSCRFDPSGTEGWIEKLPRPRGPRRAA